MMTIQHEGIDTFHQFLTRLYEQTSVGDPLQRFRMKAWEHYQELGLPTKKNDLYRYVRLKNLFSNEYMPSQNVDVDASQLTPHILPECANSTIVFVNGEYVPSLSRLDAFSKRVVISTLSEALGTFGTFLNSQWTRSLKEEKDPFVAANAALHRSALFFYCPPKTIIETPIQFLHVTVAGEVPMFMQPRVQMFVGAQSEVTFVSTHICLSGDHYGFNGVVDMAIEEDAKAVYYQLPIALGEKIWHFDALRATMKRNSRLETVNVTRGSATVRFDYRVSLIGENGEVSLNGISNLSGKDEAHAQILVDHQAPNCRSNQLFKNVLRDTSHASFEGKIYVRQAAQKTEAFQLNNNLLLSDRAVAESKPNLEIFADDVKASHGSTVGQLDADQIFYMKTRGFSEEMAKEVLVYGFCEEVVNKIALPSLHRSIVRYFKSG